MTHFRVRRYVILALVVGLMVQSRTAHSAPTTPTPTQLASEIATAVKSPTKAALESQLKVAAKSSYQAAPCVQNQAAPGNQFTACDFGTTSASKTVVLLGDSQASMWLPAFDAAGKAHNFHVILLARLGCNSNPIVLKSFSGAVDAGCADFRTASLNYIKGLTHPLVFLSQLHRYAEYANGTAVKNSVWTASMNTLFQSLKSAGATVKFLDPAPTSPVDAAACLSRNVHSSHKCTFTLNQGVIADARASDYAALTKSKISLINTFPLFCTGNKPVSSTQCPAQVAGLLVYADRWHTTSQYAAHVWRVLADLAAL